MKPIVEKNSILLFQGDSITDASRNREDGNDLGSGYAMMAAGLFNANYPNHNVKFLNRGIGGDTSKGLLERWKPDCIDLKPNCVSIMIGINDTWWAEINAAEYESNMRNILAQTEETGTKIILIEPYVMPITDEYARIRPLLDLKIEIVRSLAREFNAILVSADGMFAEACAQIEGTHWSPDGVHLYPAGNALLAMKWLRAIKAL